MKKNTRVAQSAKKKLLKKKELERLSNKQLIIFTVGLIAEVILMFFYSALKSTVSSKAQWVLIWGALAFLIIFAGFLIASAKAKKKGVDERKVKSLKNWGFCSLAFAVGSFFIGMSKLVNMIVSKTGIDASLNFFARMFTPGSYLESKKAVIIVMILVAVYVIAAMIVYAVKSAKVKKSR